MSRIDQEERRVLQNVRAVNDGTDADERVRCFSLRESYLPPIALKQCGAGTIAPTDVSGKGIGDC